MRRLSTTSSSNARLSWSRSRRRRWRASNSSRSARKSCALRASLLAVRSLKCSNPRPDSPMVWRADLLEFPFDVRNEIYEMVIGNPKIIVRPFRVYFRVFKCFRIVYTSNSNQFILTAIVQVRQCGNATCRYVTCPIGSCRAVPKGDICMGDLKQVVALAQICKQVRDEIFKLPYQNRVLYFSCTCALGLCLRNNPFVREHVQSMNLHLRGPEARTAIPLLNTCQISSILSSR
jgi:hypothetical protein